MGSKNYIPRGRLREAKEMLKDYPGAKLRIIAYPKKRPTFMKQMKVDLSEYKETGMVKFDTYLASKLDTDDWFFLDQYVTDLKNVWLIDYVLSCQDEITRGIIKDYFEYGKSCAELAEKYGLKERTIRWRKSNVVSGLAEILAY